MEKKTSTLKKVFFNMDTLMAFVIIGIVMMFIVPVSSMVLDIFITFNITFSLTVLLLTLFTTDILQFSVFPSMLLISTLFRLGLNISSTRLILTDGDAGKVIDAFGNFVVRGNYIVGAIIFIIIFIVQFVVITNGSGRVAEVAARFTLDAMPGKQMSIDADLNAGIINDQQARMERKKLQHEADFYGSMDGASKFVKGDAIAGIIIVIINIIGGVLIGVLSGIPALDALKKYCLLTIGDGLVTQIPALLTSTASGILVTRSTGESSLGKELTGQLTAFPKVIAIVSIILLLLGLIPSMPKIPFLIMAASTGFFAYTLMKEENEKTNVKQEAKAKAEIDNTKKEPENIINLFHIDILEIEIGYGLIQLTDAKTGGDLLDRIASVRRQYAMELGIMVQPIRIRDNLQIATNEYIIKIKGVEVAKGEILNGHFLVMNPDNSDMGIEGIKTVEPSFGLPAVWITPDKQEKAEMMGYTVVDPVTVLITHLTEIIKQHSYELLGRQEVKMLLDSVKENYNTVVEELVPDLLSIGDIQKVLQNLLRENVPIKDMLTILESLADNAKNTKDTEILTEYVRFSLGRQICKPFIDNNSINVITLHPSLEEIIGDNIHKSFQGSFPSLNPEDTEKILLKLKEIIDSSMFYNNIPVILSSPKIRPALKRMLEMVFPDVSVLSMNEIPGNIAINSVGMVNLNGN